VFITLQYHYKREDSHVQSLLCYKEVLLFLKQPGILGTQHRPSWSISLFKTCLHCVQTQFARLINQRTANKQCGYYHHLHFNDRLPCEFGLVPHRFSAPRCSGTESLWTSGRGILQAECPSCHPTNSVKVLRGALHALGRVSNMRDWLSSVLTSLSTRKIVLTTVFPGNQLHWYWQQKITITQNTKTHETPK